MGWICRDGERRHQAGRRRQDSRNHLAGIATAPVRRAVRASIDGRCLPPLLPSNKSSNIIIVLFSPFADFRRRALAQDVVAMVRGIDASAADLHEIAGLERFDGRGDRVAIRLEKTSDPSGLVAPSHEEDYHDDIDFTALRLTTKSTIEH